MKKNSVLIIAGEKSGEEHVLTFLPELISLCPQASFWGVGGSGMQKIGVELLYALEQFSSWGISEVFEKIPFYLQANKKILQKVKETETKVAILVDFQTFNLKLATQLKRLGVRVLYYVAPQAWAWKEYRVKILSETVHTLFTILPFEKKWFMDRGVKQVRAIAHPILKRFESQLPSMRQRTGKCQRKILLLPGSRLFEVQHLMPIFLQAVERLQREEEWQVSVVMSSTVGAQVYAPFLTHIPLQNQYQDHEIVTALNQNDICLAASGTVTLICALFCLPTIVCYKASLLTEFVYQSFISYRGPISLANIVHQEMVFPELTQDQVDAVSLQHQVTRYRNNEDFYQQTVVKLQQTKQLLQGDDFSVHNYMGQIINESYNED